MLYVSRVVRPGDAGISRRVFMRWAARGITAASIGLPALLEACSPAPAPAAAPTAAPAGAGASSGATVTSGAPAAATAAVGGAGGAAATPAPAVAPGGVKLPTYIPFQNGPQPDLPGNANGLDAAFFKFPATLAKSVPQPPGDGSDVSAIVVLTYAPPPSVDQNAAWQAVNKQLGVNLKLQMIPSADYPAALNVVIAGADLPDYIYNPTTTVPWGVIAGLPQFVKSSALT